MQKERAQRAPSAPGDAAEERDDSQEGDPPSPSKLLSQTFSRLKQTSPRVHFQMSLLPPMFSVLFPPLVFFFSIINFNLLLTKAEILQSRAAGMRKSSKQINQTQNIWATWPNPSLLPISHQCQPHLSVWSITLLLSCFDKGASGLLAGQNRAMK